jgi:hypothetical protein
MIVYSHANLFVQFHQPTHSFHPSIHPIHTNSNPTNSQDDKSKWFNYLPYSLSLFLPWQSAPNPLLLTVVCLRPSFLSVPMPSESHRACPLCLLPSDRQVCASTSTNTRTYNAAAKVKRSSLPNDENSTAR